MKYLVTWEEGANKGEQGGFLSQNAAEQWVTENLSYGIQKCRTGSYEIIIDLLADIPKRWQRPYNEAVSQMMIIKLLREIPKK